MPVVASEIPIANVFRSGKHLPHLLTGRIDVRFNFYHDAKLTKQKRNLSLG